jgi:iron(III) transport system permease protein
VSEAGGGSVPRAAVAVRPSRRGRASQRAPVPLTLLALLVGAGSLMPVLWLVFRDGLAPRRAVEQLSAPSTLPLLANTMTLALLVSIACIVLGVALAIVVVRTTLPWRSAWIVLLTMPLGVPTFVASYTWVVASLRLFPDSRFIFGLRGAVITLTLALFPYVFLPVVAALRGLDPAQEEAARSLGHSRAGAFLRVTLPQLRPAIAGGALIIALHMLAEFGALELLGYRTLTTSIVQRATVLGSPESARSLALALVVAAIALLIVERLLRGPLRPLRTGSGASRPPARWRLGRLTPLWVAGTGGVVAVALGVPLYVTVSGLTRALDGAGAAIAWETLADSALATARLGLLAAAAATLVALPVSLLAERFRGPLAGIPERCAWLAHALPGVLVALALVYLGIRWLSPLYQTSTMLVIAYVILYLPLAISSQRVGFGQADRRYDEAARSLGYGPLRTLLRTTLPLAMPGLAAGALLVLLAAGKELTTTLLLRPTGTDTLTTAMWATTNGEVLDFTTAAPYGLALMLIAAPPAYLLARRVIREEPSA